HHKAQPPSLLPPPSSLSPPQVLALSGVVPAASSADLPSYLDGIGTCWPRSGAGQMVSRPCPEMFYGVKYNTTSKSSSFVPCPPVSAVVSVLS
uniref:G-protein coupled receptors family 2 profile 1 domain-containing protein n=1 Tax=Kryptolebias marmoratus TaxID=37003 RepID=A0A3Q3ARC7_KRYMA